jgi:glycerol-3-phosphate dehydrogenase
MPEKFSFYERLTHISKLQSDVFDLLIIGGGITGAGVARDAAMRGMKVALIESQDFASGTSSRSSKLVHGGIRYLENFEFKLVFEALNERNKLFEMCPHLVHHLRFMLPLYEESRVGMLKMGLGMWAYDALALFQAPELHERLNAKNTMVRMPSLRAEKLLGSYIYSDGYMDDDRLVHETLRAAAHHQACCANYIQAIGAQKNQDGKVEAVLVKDKIQNKEFKIRAKHIVSCVGPWTDDLCSHLVHEWKKVLRPTKGIHVTLSRDRLPLSSAVVMAAEKDNRIVFGIPRRDMVIIGTTDTDYSEDPSQVIATTEDIRYLLSFTEHYFPGARITKDDLIASYAGVRPLVKDESASAGKTSREHTIESTAFGVTYVAGGKYTTYRLISEQVVQACLKHFSVEEQIQFKHADTSRALNEWTTLEAYQQAQNSVANLVSQYKKPESVVQHLVDRYGMEAAFILDQYDPRYSVWQLEAAQAVEQTMCRDLRDFFTRRVPLFLADKEHGLAHLDEVTQVFQDRLGWTDAQANEQKKLYKEFIKHELAWKKV